MDQAFRDFILAHADDDCDRLLLSKEKWPDIDVRAAVNCIISRRKLKGKLPSWWAEEELFYPNTLSAEQCSGEEAAALKAGIALGKEHRTPRIADLTGGLGVDCWSFARAGAEVLYNEMNPEICGAAQHNLPLLGVKAVFRNCELRKDNVGEILGDFRPDLIYLDPARRSGDGSKVFRLEDCSPDLSAVLEALLEQAPSVLAKLSPMADISLLVRQLEDAAGYPCVSRIHIIGSGGECKELLLSIGRQGTENPSVTVWDRGRSYSVSLGEERDAVAVPLSLKDMDNARGSLLFEPGSALMKAGPFKLLCREGMKKAGRSTQLYFTENRNLEGLGKYFRILAVLPLNKRSMKELAGLCPKAGVSARNIPMGSDELRRRLGVRAGDGHHIFGIRCDFSDAPSANYLLVTETL
ncbi:MAG: class I SAM-dependent methyltransferase [Candidatus Cryptobacteroides sp.]|nr:class I SAM-dependent methyltransferase [Bacteroidales bacterium]MDY5743434.1 class I SAM-dependent methyltransferase [Candidatus Cryptobacteroides sp.]